MIRCGTTAQIWWLRAIAAVVALFLVFDATSARAGGGSPPAPKHIIVIFEENKDLDDIVTDNHLGWLHAIIARGALFTDSHGVTHPSLPNYFAIFNGKTNADGDACSDTSTDAAGDLPVNAGLEAAMPTLASELIASHKTFVGYAEGLPSAGYVGCFGRGGSFFSSYYKRHVPWAFFTKAGHPGAVATDTHHFLLDDALNQPFSAFPTPEHYDDLPTVAMVTSDARDDMHATPVGNNGDALLSTGDAWLGRNIMPLVTWAEDPKNATLVIITWDEGRHHTHGDTNHIPTIFAGAMVKPGTDGEYITHYSVLATIERFFGLSAMTSNDREAKPITGCWRF